MALLEADVNFKVVKAFVDRVRDRAIDQDVLKSLTPSQQVVKIVRDELLALFGDAKGGLRETNARPRVILHARPAGLGQDDDDGQAARSGWASRGGTRWWCRPTCAGPAAIEQLAVVAEKAGVRVYDPAGDHGPGGARRGRARRGPQRSATTSSSSTPRAACTSTTS